MPEIKLKHIVSCNSEDKQFPVSNLLQSESFKKWKCLPGEKQATVIVQFDRSLKIDSIDIGNCGSAFVEILAGHEASGHNNGDDYDIILPAQSFMSPQESRSESNTNRVRMFNKEQMEKTSRDKKYDRVKIVCSQPYNTHIGYGLCFVRFHSGESTATATSSTAAKLQTSLTDFGKISVPDLDAAEESAAKFAPGSLFRQRDKIADRSIAEMKKNETSLKDASEKPPVKTRELPKNWMNFDKKDQKVAKISELAVKNNEKAEKSKHVAKIEEKNVNKADTKEKSAKAGKLSITANSAPVVVVPFERIMSKVVFVLSGFENPYRGQLRDKALQMGARYAPDWNKTCTHLVCAFQDTPKYNQVKKLNGKIVKKEWILDSYKEKRPLHWKRYAFEKFDKISDDEDVQQQSGQSTTNSRQQKAQDIVGHKTQDVVGRKSQDIVGPSDDGQQRSVDSKHKVDVEENESRPPTKKFKNKKDHDDDDSYIYDAPTDESDDDEYMDEQDDDVIGRGKKFGNTPKNVSKILDDVDDDLMDYEDQQQPCSSKSVLKNGMAKKRITDTDDIIKPADLPVDADGLPILPDFFRGYTFLIYDQSNRISQAERKQLNRYIVAFDGHVEQYMNPRVSHVITRDQWDREFDQARQENSHLTFLSADWLLECGRRERLVDQKVYLIEK